MSIFSKLVNFGLHILTFLESTSEALQAPKILWEPNFKNKNVIGCQILRAISIFSKLVNFGPHILTLLERAAVPLHAKYKKNRTRKSCLR